MPNLAALLNPIGVYPAFLIPLFLDRGRKNRLLVQQISTDDVVNKFVTFDTDSDNGIIYPKHLSICAEIGEPAQWAFGFSRDDYVVGDTTDVARAIDARLREGEFSQLPMLEAMAAQFCGRRQIYLRALKSGFKMLERHSKLSAAIWRDTVVLQPLIRSALSRSFLIAPDVASTVENVCVRVERKTVLLEMPAGRGVKHDLDRQHLYTNKNFDEVREVARVFDISEFDVIERSISHSLAAWSSEHPVPSGLVIGLSSTGAAIAGRSRSGQFLSKPVEVLPKSMRRQTGSVRSRPTCLFVILDLRRDQMESAISVARRWNNKGLSRIAIVRSPISFGPRRLSTLPIEESLTLTNNFEYVFVIGNHVLQKHIGFAPSLSALSKGTTYSRLCVDTILELSLWLRTRKDSQSLESVLPRDGLCLIGRGEFDPDNGWTGAVGAALSGALNERLPIENAKLLVITTGRGPETDKWKTPFFERYPEISQRRVHSIGLGSLSSWRRGATLIAANVWSSEPTPERFARFCSNLICSLGWSISRDPSVDEIIGFVASSRGLMIRILTYTTGSKLVDFVVAANKMLNGKKPDRGASASCVLANCRVPKGLKDLLLAMRVDVIHYSMFEKWVTRHFQ